MDGLPVDMVEEDVRQLLSLDFCCGLGAVLRPTSLMARG